jgi:hypothetical protein
MNLLRETENLTKVVLEVAEEVPEEEEVAEVEPQRDLEEEKPLPSKEERMSTAEDLAEVAGIETHSKR